MAKISLRVYNKEIDSLIERGDNAEAIAHCKYILKIYPKYIQTYSLLGKAYLESQRDSEGLDIFQRVLSVYPDDFIAHLSLSIIRQGEDNLDAAIFHMERAYEVQPSKIEVQNELRRLYGRRDGVTPPRVRLTRGALVRMYERGELYRQAIAEIQAALTENPGRIDLQVVLCRMFYLAGQKVEATDTASHLLSKLPYCFEANRILAEILPGTSRADDASVFQKRVVEVDPYFAFTPLSSPNSLHVPDNSIQLEQLVYRMNEPVTDTGWAQNLGISLPGPTQSEELPDWFQTNTVPAAQGSQAQTPENEPIASLPAGEAEIPEFIRQAGFTSAIGPEQPTTLEIPDWLQSIAPAETQVSQASTTEDDSWFAGLMQQNEQPASDNLPELTLPDPDKASSVSEPSPISPELPDWLKEVAPQEEATSTTIPDWISQPPVMPDRNETTESEETLPSSVIPDWLQGIDIEQTTSADQSITPGIGAEEISPEETPDWLQALSIPSEPIEPSTAGAEANESEITESVLPDWITSNLSEPSSESVEEITTAASGEAIDSTTLPEEIPAEILPDILETPEVGQKDEAPISVDEILEVETEATSAELPDWLKVIPAPSDQSSVVPLDLISEENLPAETADTTELPDWLAGLDQVISQPLELGLEEPVLPAPAMVEQQTVEIAEIPESVEVQIVEAAEVPELVDEQASKALEVPEGIGEQIIEPIESPQALMEEPVISETILPVIEPNEVETEIPEQIGELIPSLSQDDEDSQAPTRPIAIRHPTIEPSEEVKVDEAVPTPELISSEEIKAVNEGFTSVEPALEISAQMAEEKDIELNPEALVQSTNEIAAETITEPEIQPVEEFKAGPILDSTVHPTEEMPTDLDAALAWMETLAARQGADESTLSIAPEDRSAEIPDWLQQEIENAPESTLPPPPVAEESGTEVITEMEAGIPSETEQIVELAAEPQEIVSSPIPTEEILPPSEIEQPDITPELIEVTPTREGISETSEWLQTFQVDEAEAVPPESELPDWLKGVEESDQSSEALPEAKESKEEWIREETITESLPFVNPALDIPVEHSAPESEISPHQPEEVSLSTESSPVELLEQAQSALRHNDLIHALNNYEDLVNSGNLIEETIHDLREAIDRHPMETPLYQILGDAYMRSNRLQDAIDNTWREFGTDICYHQTRRGSTRTNR
jgi:tetratricopeptide (TPR) repeat protein